MKSALPLAAALLLIGCASPSADTSTNPPPAAPAGSSTGPNWEEIDKTVQRVKERERNKPRLVETETHTDTGFAKMSDDDYAAELDQARAEVKKANPKMSDGDVETEAAKRADQAKRRYELGVQHNAGSTYELKKP
jgi:hypothetical protein